MGDRYDLILNCVYCNEVNDVWYAPTCSSDTFVCKKCEKLNFVIANFKTIKIEYVTFEMVKEGFLFATSGGLTEDEINICCKTHFKLLKKE